MDEAQAVSPRSDDTAAFQRFYAGASAGPTQARSVWYRVLIGWWRDRR